MIWGEQHGCHTMSIATFWFNVIPWFLKWAWILYKSTAVRLCNHELNIKSHFKWIEDISIVENVNDIQVREMS